MLLDGLGEPRSGINPFGLETLDEVSDAVIGDNGCTADLDRQVDEIPRAMVTSGENRVLDCSSCFKPSCVAKLFSSMVVRRRRIGTYW